MDRDEILKQLTERPDVEILVVGAGINGIGTFRDLALNDVDVLLIDRADFCSGASAASSHMAHGGIRYLENGEFRLVREAVRERNLMIENAPHIVRPLPTTIPMFRLFSGILNAPLKFLGLLDRPSERGSLVIKIGLMVYDAYTGRQRTVPRHSFMNRRQSLLKWNKLNPAVLHTATYFDGAILQPERLGLELVLDAEADGRRARALNYVGLEGASGRGVLLRDTLTGESYEVRPRVLINATGPWIDLTNGALGVPSHFIEGTKGSHIVLDHPELRNAIGDHEFFFENQDGRIVLIFPLFDRVLIGTSDLSVPTPDGVRCTEEEVDYFVDLVRRVFPGIRVDRSQIVFRFSGVRPLAASTARTTGQMSRDHAIRALESQDSNLAYPVLSLAGGKWTSWRAFSEQVTDQCLFRLGKPRKLHTTALRIGGGKGYPRTSPERAAMLAHIAAAGGLSSRHAEEWLNRYGTRALQMAESLTGANRVPLRSLPSYLQGELEFLAAKEKVARLDDMFLRRTMLAMLGRLTREALSEVGGIVAARLGWNADRLRVEIARALELLNTNHQAQL